MSAPTVTFWPADLANRVVRSPVAVLRQAAGELTTMTGGLLEGQVLTSRMTNGSLKDAWTTYELRIVASGLDRYSVGLLELSHRRELPYPAILIAQELGYDDENGDVGYPSYSDDVELTSAMQQVLHGARVRSIVFSLLARLNDTADESNVT